MLLSRKEIHGRRLPPLARFAMERVEKGKKYKLRRYCRRNTVSHTTARVTRYARYRFFCIHTRLNGMYRPAECIVALNVCVPWMVLISRATISVVDFGSPCIIRRIPKASLLTGYRYRSRSIARLLSLIRKRDVR